MTFLPLLSSSLQETLGRRGVPLPVASTNNPEVYMLMEIRYQSLPDGGYLAQIPAINAYGEGGTREEAALALREALRKYITAFGDAVY